jgi:hypothetical protein
MLLYTRVILIATWRWLGERLSIRLIFFCFNVCRVLLILYLVMLLFGYYSFGWFI